MAQGLGLGLPFAIQNLEELMAQRKLDAMTARKQAEIERATRADEAYQQQQLAQQLQISQSEQEQRRQLAETAAQESGRRFQAQQEGASAGRALDMERLGQSATAARESRERPMNIGGRLVTQSGEELYAPPAEPKYHSVGGYLFRETPTGVEKVAEGRPPQGSTSTLDDKDRELKFFLDKEADIRDKAIQYAPDLASRGYDVQAVIKDAQANYQRKVDALMQKYRGGGAVQAGPASGTVRMRAPNGQIKEVPLDQVEHYKRLNAVEVP